MSTEEEKKQSSKKPEDEEEFVKYAVACSCAQGRRPSDNEMTKLADNTFQCLHCGRRHA